MAWVHNLTKAEERELTKRYEDLYDASSPWTFMNKVYPLEMRRKNLDEI